MNGVSQFIAVVRGIRGASERALLLAGFAALFIAACSQSPPGAEPQVIISEFSAANESGLTDAAGEHHDWVELRNLSGAPIDLGGWKIADSGRTYEFPQGTEMAAEYLVLFASGQVASGENRELHLPFKLDADGDLLVLTAPEGQAAVPQLPAPFPAQQTDTSYGPDEAGRLRFWLEPTPGGPNTGPGITESVELSAPHGLVDGAFELSLRTRTESAQILYTTDGSSPSAGRATALPPDGSLMIDATTTVRAVAQRAGWEQGPETVATYVFPSELVQREGVAAVGFPASGEVNGQVMAYGMRPPNGGSQLVVEALRSLPWVIVTADQTALFDSEAGIYVNAEQRGRSAERPSVVEYLDPSGREPGFTIDAGLRIRGGFSRRPENPKHSFRLAFRPEYAGALEYSAFGAEGDDRFERLDLRTAQNYAWHWFATAEATFVREVFSRDTQAAMGQPSTRSRFVHLLLNGEYWGIYMTQERVTGEYGESYFGGDEDDYDVVKRAHNAARVEAISGDRQAWFDLWAHVEDLTVTDTEFEQLEQLVALENLADYYLVHFFTGDHDSAPSWYNVPSWSKSNNWIAMRRRDGTGDAGRWIFFDHDSEHSLCVRLGPMQDSENLQEVIHLVDNTPPWNLLTGRGATRPFLSPAWLHEALITHPGYVALFKERVRTHLIDPAGVLAETQVDDRIVRRLDEVRAAVPAEAARWGWVDPDRARPSLTSDDWERAADDLRDCARKRRTVLEVQLREDGLWPE